MIYGIKFPPVPQEYGDTYSNSRANTKIVHGGYEISIFMDDSCGTMENLSRTDMRVYRTSNDEDVTYEVFPELIEHYPAKDGFPEEVIFHTVEGTFENLHTVMCFVRQKMWETYHGI